MKFTVRERKIRCTNESLIGDNADYVASFTFDSEWEGKIKTARFIMNGKYKDVILTDDACTIPVELLKAGCLKIGVFSDEMTTTHCEVYINASVKESTGVPAKPTDDVYAQIISMIENMETGGVSEEQIAGAVEAYMAEHPVENKGETACKIIAHRGYHETYPQNTIAAFKDAIDKGFDWLEIDIRRCADGFYVMSHDNAVTLYSEGNAIPVTISESNYAEIKNYTWDAEGKYIINTLQATFNALKAHDVKFICDLKNGTNVEIAQIAALCGMTDRILLSYGSPTNALGEVEFLKKYDNVPIRVVPTDYQSMLQLAEAITNKIYCDVNAYMTYHFTNYLPIALACGFPVLFSGCTLDNYKVWSVVASGCMANENLNIKHDEFLTLLQNNYDMVSEISVSQYTVDVTAGESINITASSNLDVQAGYLYAYSQDNTVCKVVQKTFGNNVNLVFECITVGDTNIVVFDGVGNILRLPVSVKDKADVPVLGEVSDVEYIIGASISGKDGKVYGNLARMVAVKTTGNIPLVEGDEVWDGIRYAINVPTEATKIIIKSPNHIAGFQAYTVDEATNTYTMALDAGWLSINESTYEFEAGKYSCVVINYKNSSNSNINATVDLSGFSIVFE